MLPLSSGYFQDGSSGLIPNRFILVCQTLQHHIRGCCYLEFLWSLIFMRVLQNFVDSLKWTITPHNLHEELRAGWPRGRSSSPGGVKNFLFSRSSRPPLRSTQPPIQWVPGALSLGIKRRGLEVDHSPPTSAEVKKMWIYTSTPTYAFMA
jgi:hypothetical protein